MFASNWRKITADPWLLSIVGQGYCIEFSQPPPACPDRPLRCTFSLAEKQQTTIEVGNLLLKGGIRKCTYDKTQFLSNLFLIPKKSGEMRPVINLNV